MQSTYQRITNYFLGSVAVCLLGVLGYLLWMLCAPIKTAPDNTASVPLHSGPPRGQTAGNLTTVWDELPENFLRVVSRTDETRASNIHPQDYAGPDACRKCHPKKHEAWSGHPHRWMNALVGDADVVGDFSDATIDYHGGAATFFLRDGDHRMRFDRSDLTREYKVTQTIGSRFYQYYVGRGLSGPEPPDHDFYHVDQLLPFGYWIDRKAWVPVVHILAEAPDGERWDPLEDLVALPESDTSGQSLPVTSSMPGSGRGVTITGHEHLTGQYSAACNVCHTTFALGDMFVRSQETNSTPHKETDWFFAFSNYLADSHPELWDGDRSPNMVSTEELAKLITEIKCLEAPGNAVSLGVTCEACHLGCREHVQDKSRKPSFLPHSPHLFSTEKMETLKTGRTRDNVNGICKRCHSGNRPKFAAGMATWNSTEYSDAMVGSCYTQLTCVQCHDPHEATGKKWSRTRDQDDESCLKCHKKLIPADRRVEHTHHPMGSEGSRCMACHMPKINEGMQDVVRTHAIFSPNHTGMIERNQPNACSLCHLEESIDWTTSRLTEWYGTKFSEDEIDRNYEDCTQPVGLGWLKQEHEATRLVAVEALTTSNSQWALPEIIELLDDDFLLNRQFTQKGLESMLSTDLAEDFGYWFYMTKEERQEPVRRILERYGR